MQKLLLTMLLTMAIWEATLAQSTVTGKVTTGNGETLPGVSIVVKGTLVGTTTDAAGSFSLNLPSGSDVLVFSFIGYKTIEAPLNGRTSINVTLEEDVKSLEEIVVVGYGTTSKRLVSGAISTVSGSNLNSLNPTRFDQALQGQVAGVQISSASGSPGGSLNIRIRGITTNGDNNPLIIVDGVLYSADGLNALNPADIESINVLKDAAAAIYGVQAANGVILITTKMGKRNTKPTIEMGGYYGLQETTKKISLLNAREYAILKNETYGSGGLTPPFNNVNLGTGTNWQDEIFKQTPIQNYNLNINGGTDRSSYSFGGSFLDQEGIIGEDKSRFRRYNARINFTTDLSDKISLQSVLLYTNEFRKTLPENGIGSVLYNTINASPANTIYDANGAYTYLLEFNDIINPVAQMANTFNETNVNKIVGKEELKYTINDHFEITGRAGYNYAIVDGKFFSPLVYYGPGKAQNTALNANLDPKQREIATGVFLPENGNVTENRTSYFNYNFEAFLNYNNTFGEDHEVKAMLGTSLFGTRNDHLSGTGFGVPYNSWDYADISNTENPVLNNTSSWQDRNRLQSFFARAEYSYMGKYLFSGIIRRDGSSNFGTNNRFGYFPSVSAGWVISEENFFSNFKAFDLIKLRASYGVSGSDKIGTWRYRALLGGEGVYPFNDQLVSGVAIRLLGNPDLKWETLHQANFGIDVAVLNNSVTFNADYYVKKTRDLLFQPDISGVLGGYGAGEAPPFVNGGDIRNTGLELAIGYNETIGQDFKFNISYNLTTIRNEVTRLPNGVEFIPAGAFGVGGSSATRMEVGFPIGYFFGYKTDGIYQNQAEITERGVTQAEASPGDLRFVDIDNSGTIEFGNNSDRTIIGSPIPEFTMGLNVGFNFKGFDFQSSLYASVGNEILRNYERQQPLANMLEHNIGRWTGEGSTNEIPRLTTAANRNNVISDYFIEDGSFVRIKNLQLGYTLPASISSKFKSTRLRIYIAANNLATFTKYKGFDPDFSSANPLASGIDYGFYPQARTYMAGFNLNF